MQMPLKDRAHAPQGNSEARQPRWPDGTINHTKDIVFKWLAGLADRFRDPCQPISMNFCTAPSSRSGPGVGHDSIAKIEIMEAANDFVACPAERISSGEFVRIEHKRGRDHYG